MSLGEFFISERPKLGDSVDSFTAVAAVMWGSGAMGSLLHVLNDNSGSWSFDFSNFVRGSVVAKSSSIGNSLDHLMVNMK